LEANYFDFFFCIRYLISNFLSSHTRVANVLVKQNCTVDLPGGPLEIEWREEDNHVYMTGPAEMVFDGSVPLRYLLE
jgi:hypothetical protein